jgi:broad specificity phosphatase PhoE
MDTPISLYIVRHGHTYANRPWTFLGRSDPPLSDIGIKQVEQLKTGFYQVSVNVIYTSPLARAKQTTSLLQPILHCPFIVDERLIEQDFGLWEGLHIDTVKEKYATDFNNWIRDAYQYAPTGGETSGEVLQRQQALLNKIRQKHPGKTVVIVGHGSGINALLCAALETSLHWRWAYHLNTAHIAELHIFERNSTLIRFNYGENGMCQ